MPDMDNSSITRKSFEKMRYTQVVDILIEFVGATTITKCILELKMSFTVGKLLASILAIDKQLTKAIYKDVAVQFHVNTLGSAKV